MNEYTIQIDSVTDGLASQAGMQPNWAGIVLSMTVFGVILLFVVRQMFGSEPFKKGFAEFKRRSLAARTAIIALWMAAIVYGGPKSETNEMERASSPPVVLLRSAEQTASAPAAVEFTESQQLAGFALAAVVTNEAFDLSAPTNAVVHANWLKRGASEDGFWAALDGFPLGTNRRDAVYVSSSGTLSFNKPKSSPVARPMPDGSSIAFLAPLQTVLGIPPQARWNAITNYELQITNSLFWSDVTDSGSARFTWQNALLDRATNAPVSFQAELFPSGDFIFRYEFTSLAASRWPLAPDYVIGAQNNGGGETALIATDAHACSATNHLCATLYSLDGTNVLSTPLCAVVTNSPKFSLRWTAFGDYDPADPDPDGDGIATPDEVLLHHTNPSMPDTDLDGVSDGGELAAGTGPLLRDTDGDGLVDGADPDPLSATSPDDLDGDGIPDAYETAMFGSTNVVNDLDHDPNGTGFPLSTKIAAGMDPAATPAEATIPLDNLESLKLFDGFRCDFTNAPRVVYSRTFDIDRDGGWQQYFLSSAPDKAGAWKLDGMVLEWEDSAGGSGTATASPRDDSFRIPVSTNSPSQLTLALRATSTNSICPQPLYLLTWSPGISISGATQAVIDGALCQAVEWEGADGSVDILYDLSNRPCKAGPFAAELAARLNPLPGDSRLVFTPDGSHTGGSLTAKAPGAYAMPWAIVASGAGTSISMPSSELVPMKAAAAGEGGGACRLLFFDPFMSYGDGHCGGCGSTLVFDTATGTYVASYDYPLDSRCLRDNWRRDSSGAYPCTCQAEIFYGDDSLADYFTEDITPDNPRAIGTILFGGIPVWSGEATHHVDDDCHDPFSDGCDGCSSGCADGNCDALEGEALGSLAFRIPLGMPRDAQISGFLWFKATEPTTITPSLFNLLIRDDANVVAVTNNGLRNVTCSDVRGRTAVIDDIPGGVRITVRKTADNSLEHTWVIVNVDDDPEEIQLTKISRLDNEMSKATYAYADGEWTRSDNIAQSSEQVIVDDHLNDPENAFRYETRIVRDASGALLSETTVTSRRFGAGKNAVLREVSRRHKSFGDYWSYESWIDDGATYWEDDDHPRRNGRPRLVWGESRPWSYQAWDDEGREILRLDQWDGSEAPMQLAEFAAPSELADLAAYPAISAIATVSDYAPLPGDSDAPADIDAVRTESRHLVRDGAATLIGRTWRIHTHGTDTVGRAFATVQTIRAGSQTAALDDPGNAVSTETHYDADADGIPLLLRGRPVTSTDEDGVTTAYDYALGNYAPATHAFTPNASGTALRTLVSSSTAAAPNGIPGKSTQSLTIQDAAHGTTLYSATLLRSTGATLDWQANAYDDKNRLRSTLYSDGSSTTNAYSCCRLLWTQDRNGFKTLRSAETGKDHLYYAMEEESLAQLPGYGYGHRTTMHFMDALGRETNTIVTAVGDPGSASLPDCWTLDTYATETTTYPDGISDHAVHVDRRGVRTVSTSRSFADREESVALTFHPTNLAVHVLASTNITYRNGHSISIQSWDGGWTHETSWVDYTANGTRCSFSVTEASDSPSAVTNQISQSDFLGRTVETLTPGAAGGWLVTSNAYDGATSRLTCSETTGQPATTYLYDVLGESVATVQSGITTASENRYETIDGEVWQVAIRRSSLDGITNAVSISRRQMTGLSNSLRSRTVSIDANGSTTMEESAFDPQTCELTTTRTTDSATPFITISKFGRTIRRESLRDAVDYYFDPLGRAECSDVFHPVTDEILYSRWSAFDESDNETDYGIYYYGDDLYVSGSKTFDAFNREATRTDALGNTVATIYDALGRPVASSGATYPIRYGYDTMGRMKALGTTRDGSTFDETRWGFNQATGLVTNKIYADDSAIVYSYTSDGKPLRTTWARGAWRENAYNADGLPYATTYSDATPAASLGYDAFQRLAFASNVVAAYTYKNSKLGTATNETSTIGGGVFTLTRKLDDRHRLASLGVGDAQAHFDYDVENRLATVSNAVFTVAYAYTTDGWDAGHAVTLTNGTIMSRTVVRDAYRRNLVTAISNSVDDVAVNLLDYDHDLLNRATSRNADTFGYNARSEVTDASILSNAYTYAYDNIGNHTTSTVDSVATTYAANALNQYTAILCAPAPLREPSHDLDGNLLTNGVWSYEYDAENRLAAAYSNSLCVVSNAYDHMGRRVLKVSHGGTETRRFVYDGWNLVQETIQNQQSTITNHYVWGKDLSGTLQGAGGVGGLLAVTLNDSWYFPLTDANGNITAYIDEQGSVVAEYAYDAFGDTIAQSSALADSFAHRFSTKYYDAETGLYYYGYRFYDPFLHRWLNRDPIEEKGGQNLYAFCGNDAENRWDMLGLWKEPADDDFYGNYLKGLYQNSRKVYRFERGDSLAGLARKAKLGIEDIAGWARFNPGHSTETTEYLVSSEGWRKFCYVSVPNVWIDADLLRGGGVYSRVVNMGGSIGSFVGTDLLTSGSRKVVTVQTVTDLIQALQTNMGDIWGMTVYGHGGPDGTLSQRQQISNADWGESWINQRMLIDSVGKGGYKLAVVNMMQCYSGTSMGTYRGKFHDWGGDWRMHAIVFNYYEGLNVLGLDMGWKTWPWNWF